MAPDRGGSSRSSTRTSPPRHDDSDTDTDPSPAPADADAFLHAEPSAALLAARAAQPQFTPRALALGLAIGILIAFSNTYFGLQTGWISGMAMPSALIGFAYFKGLATLMHALGDGPGAWGWGAGFSEVENVLVQTVAGSVGTMPLGCGFVGVVPAMEFLLRPEETPGGDGAGVVRAFVGGVGGLRLPLGKLVLWAVGLCFFGVVFAVPLRKEVIVREKLKFPSGTATALMIGVLHGGEKTGVEGEVEEHARARRRRGVGGGRHDESGQRRNRGKNGPRDEESQALMGDSSAEPARHSTDVDHHREHDGGGRSDALTRDWKAQIRLLTYSFGVSGGYTLLSYFFPALHNIPLLGPHLATHWLWTLNPSPAYIGQGIIMGPATTLHMFLGCLVGWGVLSPLAKHRGWAPGEQGLDCVG
ncbi:hypothetical protein LTR08_007581 [Meristemomyces frigidus]|nr:hypothetical protein LTR08_007581 [Meristemomyces frigidus]